MSVSETYMFDTNVFNFLVKNSISSHKLRGIRILITGIQADELCATNDDELRNKLLSVLAESQCERVSASSFAFDVEGAGFDQACWHDGSHFFHKMLQRL